MNGNEGGFTLVELISTIAASALFVGLILYFGISYWRYSALLESDLDTFVSRLNAQDFIRESVGTTTGLIGQNSIPDTHTSNPDPVAGSNYWLQKHAVPGNIPIGASGTTTPLLYFRRISTNTSNVVVMNGTQPYEDEYVLYLDGTNKQLLLRTLANTAVANNKLKTSCPAASATSSCPADKILLDNLSSVDVVYYSRSGNTIDHTSSCDSTGQQTGDNSNNCQSGSGIYNGPDFPSVEALQYTFHVQKKTLFQTGTSTINDTVVRIALRNT